MKIRLDIEGMVVTATLADNATSRNFVSLLPLSLTLQDYAATEKISDLPKRLSTAGAPRGSEPSSGDISYYSPWGNLALFYKGSGYADGLVELGRFDSGVEALRRLSTLRVTKSGERFGPLVISPDALDATRATKLLRCQLQLLLGATGMQRLPASSR